jgi:cytochrome b pre-mRNA-processing protein 3
MSLFRRLFSPADPREAVRPLYASVIARAREPHWYAQGGVPDTLDGRFDMVAAVLSFVLLRLEREEAAKQESVWLTEIFVDDMDSQLRQIGIGDMVVGKHIGKMMSALGGRLAAYRPAVAGGEALREAIDRNLYRGAPPADAQRDHVAQALENWSEKLEATPVDRLLAGELP